jgi:adenylyltransferase/sulfurtransferase
MTRYGSDEIDRYHRQILLPQIGAAGQAALAKSRVLLVGCGALGCQLAEELVRAGVGFLRIADRDVVELTNLQRQTLFDENDAKAGAAKSAAATRRLGQINSGVTIEPLVTDVWAGNIDELVRMDRRLVDVILDGTDNVQTRYLLNDAAVKHGVPWVHAACVGMEGRVMAIKPGEGACLRCIFPTPPAAGELPTCDTAGVLQAAAATAASLQAAQAIKLLVGKWTAADQRLWKLDVWSGRFAEIDLQDARDPECPCCGRREFAFLDSSTGESIVSLCGRNAVQIRPARPWKRLEFEPAVGRLGQVGQVESGEYFSRCRLREPAGFTITCFPDGRLVVQGTADTGRAKSICARFIGS